MPETNLVTIPNITLVETGTWLASTGEVTFTASDLAAAVAALDDPAIKTPRLRFGHTTAGVSPYESAGGFDSQPCVGKFTNLRLENDGHSLVADLVGVPKWLAEILPVAYPNRSVEAYYAVSTQTGKKHDMIITSVAVLGEELPAVQTLEDLELLFSEDGPEWAQELEFGETVLANRKEDDVPTRVAASVDTSDVRQAFYEQIATEESGRYWWWLHQVYLDPKAAIAEDDDGDFWLCSYSFNGNEVEFGDPEKVFIQWVNEESGKVAASAAAQTFGRPASVFASAADSRPAERQQQFNDKHKKEARATVPIDITALRARLGVGEDVLPDDASEEQINAALSAKPPEEEGGTEEETETETTAVAASAKPGIAEDGNVVHVDKEVWEQTRAGAQEGLRLAAEGRKAEDVKLLDDQINAGALVPASRDRWLSKLAGPKKDHNGPDRAEVREYISKLEAGIIPVDERGSSEEPSAHGGSSSSGTGWFNFDREEAGA